MVSRLSPFTHEVCGLSCDHVDGVETAYDDNPPDESLRESTRAGYAEDEGEFEEDEQQHQRVGDALRLGVVDLRRAQPQRDDEDERAEREEVEGGGAEDEAVARHPPDGGVVRVRRVVERRLAPEAV